VGFNEPLLSNAMSFHPAKRRELENFSGAGIACACAAAIEAIIRRRANRSQVRFLAAGPRVQRGWLLEVSARWLRSMASRIVVTGVLNRLDLLEWDFARAVRQLERGEQRVGRTPYEPRGTYGPAIWKRKRCWRVFRDPRIAAWRRDRRGFRKTAGG